MRGDLMRMVLLHGAAKDVAAVSQGACEGVGGGPAIVLMEVPDDGAFPMSWAHGIANNAALMYAMGQLGPFGPPAEPPKAKTPKVEVATPHTPLRDRKKELRRLKADKARAARLKRGVD